MGLKVLLGGNIVTWLSFFSFFVSCVLEGVFRLIKLMQDIRFIFCVVGKVFFSHQASGFLLPYAHGLLQL